MGESFRNVGVVGCGLMGSGIAQVCAAAGFPTRVREVDEEALARGLRRIDDFLAAGVERGRTSPDDAARVKANLSGTTRLDDLAGCDLVIEAIVERAGAKRETFSALEDIVGPGTVFASNTSSLCITELASATERPDRFVGLHFFSPVPVMKLVEVIRGLATSAATFERALAFGRSLGKEPVTAPDRPGFIANRLLIPYPPRRRAGPRVGRRDDRGHRQDDDPRVRLSRWVRSPLLDFVGLDTAYSIANIMYDEFRDPKYAPPPLLKRMVLAGRLGRKSGQGFYA